MGPKEYVPLMQTKKKNFMWALMSVKNFSPFPKWYAILMLVHYEVAVNCLTARSAECLAGRAVPNLPFRNGRTFKVAAVSRTELSAGFTTWAPAQLLLDTVRYEHKEIECLFACRETMLTYPHMQPCELLIYWYLKILVWKAGRWGAKSCIHSLKSTLPYMSKLDHRVGGDDPYVSLPT